MSLNESNQSKTSDKTATQTTAKTNAEATSTDADTCVVCFKNVEIYSIGECDHPVCHECSTRMRVLCQQNECPICRQVLGKVIFTYDKLPYRELESKNRSEYYNKRYKIGFYSNDIQKRFFELLDHPCPKCNTMPYRSFQGLRDHVRREHNLHYCDLCVDNLKIFTFERRCYTQAELGLHRTKGDPDNKSHRGHPLCEYCNKRYLDRDELFRHLRREHYFCHFCDADGCNEFYKDYDALAEHFRQDHYLCEEGKCASEQFVGAFRTEIDYKAHVASVHGKTLNKQQAKQTRTLQLEITLGPRGRGQAEQNVANMRSRGNENETDEIDVSPFYAQHQSQRPVTIDSQNEQDFPSLSGGSAASMPVVPLMPFPMRRSVAAGLARTKENFPALGGGGGSSAPPQRSAQQQQQQNQQQGPPISSMLKKTSTTNNNVRSAPSTSGPGNSGGNGSSMVIHVSNRPTQSTSGNGAIAKKPTTPNSDFPALPSTSSVAKGKKQNHPQSVPKQQHQQQQINHHPFQHHQKQQLNNQQQQQQQQKQPQSLQTQKSIRPLDEDMITTQTSNVPAGVVAAKHRTLMDDYVSVANPKNFQKIQMIQQEDAEAQSRKNAAERNKTAPKLSSEEFPSLGGGSSNSSNNIPPSTSGNWTKPISEKRQRELENRKAKIAPAPVLPTPKDQKSSTNKTSPNSTTKEKQLKEKNSDSSVDQHKQQQNQGKSNAKNKEKQHNNNNNTSNNNDNRIASNTNLATNDNENSQLRPPPGFNSGKSDAAVTKPPPPGFLSDVTVNSVAKSPNNLIFTSSMGESYSIVPKHKYSQPTDSLERNQKLVNDFQKAMSCYEAFQQFHIISQRFREGLYKADAYYEHCQVALKDKFDVIFPELLVLLPDISKQQALYLEHAQRLKTMTPAERKLLPQLQVCAICKQVVLSKDSDGHQRMHEFPSLISTKLNATGGRRK